MLYDYRFIVAVDACKQFGKCSQICMNREGGDYKCGCVAGYRLERKDQRTCKAIGMFCEDLTFILYLIH